MIKLKDLLNESTSSFRSKVNKVKRFWVFRKDIPKVNKLLYHYFDKNFKFDKVKKLSNGKKAGFYNIAGGYDKIMRVLDRLDKAKIHWVVPMTGESVNEELKDLIVERIMSESDFSRIINQARKETGAQVNIPSGTKKLCKEVMKEGFNRLDYKGKPGKKRYPTNIMYQYYAYVQGWGHTKFKSPADWFIKGIKFDPILKWIYESDYYSNPFDYDYLKYHVDSDMQSNQVVGNIRPGSKDVEPAYYLVKDYWNSFDMSRNHRNFDVVVNKVQWWLDKNKVETR